MMDWLSSSSLTDSQGADELQEFLHVEQQKGQIRAEIQALTDTCWDKCIDKPSAKLDGRSSTCLENCAARFVDVTFLISNRFAQVLQRKAKQ